LEHEDEQKEEDLLSELKELKAFMEDNKDAIQDYFGFN